MKLHGTPSTLSPYGTQKVLAILSVIGLTPKMKTVEFVNCIDLDEVAHNKPTYLAL